MKYLNIFVRQDLKMRKGKMAAQSAHSAMKLLFEVMKKTPTKMVLLEPQVKEFDEFLTNPNIKIHMVKDEDALHQTLDPTTPHSIIVDSGRTEFHGVPTVTCAAQGLFDVCDINELVVPHAYGKDIKAKQIFVFNKDFPLSKEMACELSVLTCLQILRKKMKLDEDGLYFDLSEDSAFVAWILNAFGKIALSSKTLEELEEVSALLAEKNIDFVSMKIKDNTCLSVEPCYPEIIDPITGTLSLI